jgi:hypothetical protein
LSLLFSGHGVSLFILVRLSVSLLHIPGVSVVVNFLWILEHKLFPSTLRLRRRLCVDSLKEFR